MVLSIAPVSVSANDSISLNVCWETPDFLTEEQLKKLEELIKENFDEAGVDVTFSKAPPPCNPDGPGEVGVTFVRNGAQRTGDRTSQVDISRSERPGATANQVVRGIADTTAHEIAEIYLEDLAPDPNNAYKMEGYFNWTDAQNPNLTFSEENKKLLRKFIKEDNITYKKDLDEVAHIVPPESPVIGDTDFAVLVMAEPMTVPLGGAEVEFDGVSKYTDDEGMVQFQAPLVEEDTKYTLSAQYFGLLIDSIEFIVHPETMEEVTEEVEEFAESGLFEELKGYVETSYNPNLGKVPWFVKSVIGNERINAQITLNEGGVLTIGAQTKDAAVVKFQEGEISKPSMKIYTTEGTINSIINSGDPIGRTQEALAAEEITYEGVRIGSRLKLGIATLGVRAYGFYGYISGLIG
ncbi:MAG: hypothetical protein SVM80_04475 [Halobacteriota archaeon]|nr:hypothetical protein [Halobacteriota archaeon]